MTVYASTRLTVPATTVSELLVPVDLSHESWGVLPLARSIAARLAIPVVPLFVDVSTSEADVVPEHSLLLRATVAGEPAAVEVIAGSDIAAAIGRRADDQAGSVVAMSTPGLSAFLARAWGNVCGELLKSRAASILAVGPRFDADRHADVQRVAVCIDAAAPDRAIVHDALRWANALRVPMIVVTVCGAGRSRPGDDETYHVLAAIFEDLPPSTVSVTAEALDALDVAAEIVRFADRRPGTLLALAPGAAERAVHLLTHSVTMQVARESSAALLLRWHQPDVVPAAS